VAQGRTVAPFKLLNDTHVFAPRNTKNKEQRGIKETMSIEGMVADLD
jgi:hypothetical protein